MQSKFYRDLIRHNNVVLQIVVVGVVFLYRLDIGNISFAGCFIEYIFFFLQFIFLISNVSGLLIINIVSNSKFRLDWNTHTQKIHTHWETARMKSFCKSILFNHIHVWILVHILSSSSLLLYLARRYSICIIDLNVIYNNDIDFIDQ